MRVLNEKGEQVDLPEGSYPACGHVHPGDAVKPSLHNRAQQGFWGQAPGPSGYYRAYWWNAELGRAFFVIGCQHSASHMQPDIGQAALRVEWAKRELFEAERALKAVSA